MLITFVIIAVICLAYANGSNDNFKGVATLFGSGTTNYQGALYWATTTTFLGSLAAVLLAEKLLKTFSGKGLVENDLIAAPEYGAAVAFGAGLTVLIATRVGMPISTTHSLVGALIGAGWAADSVINFGNLGSAFVLPLLISPFLAVGVTFLSYPALSFVRKSWRISEETCFCVGKKVVEVGPTMSHAAAIAHVHQLSVSMDDVVTCEKRYNGKVLGLEATRVLDRLHYLSAGMVSFARGLNDTPKIAALLLLTPFLGKYMGSSLVGVAIAIGGLVSARRVGETMSKKITFMNHGQGFTANLITSLIVIGASHLGMPVSTTHVSCGSLFGIAAATKQGHARMIATILGAWFITLPLGALLGALCFSLATQL